MKSILPTDTINMIKFLSILFFSFSGLACDDTKKALEKAGQGKTIVSFHQYMESMRVKGWDVQTFRNPDDAVVIELTKQKLSEDGHGLLDLKWQEKIVWKFIYAQSDDNTLVIADTEGKMFIKAPIGAWQLEREYNNVPNFIHKRKLDYNINTYCVLYGLLCPEE